MKKAAAWLIGAAGIILTAVNLWIFLKFLGEADSNSIGIIGGADAPTAEFLTGQLMKTPAGIGLAAGLVMIVTAVVLLCRREKKK